MMDVSNHGGTPTVAAPLSSAASTTDGTWCTVHGSSTDPDDCSQIFYIQSLLILYRF